MKIRLLGAAMIFGAASMHAQITITQWDLVEVGDQLFQAQDTLPANGPGNGGANQTWNFTSLDTVTLSELVFTNPSWTSEGAQFPNSNLEVDINNGDTYLFFDKHATALEVLGFVGDFGFGPMTLANTDPEVFLKLPLNYMDSYSDTSIADITVDGATAGFPVDSARLKQHHDRTYNVDGWGTVTTPVGTFDALRQYVVDIQHDTVWVQNFGVWTVAQTSIDTNYNYAWWSDDPSLGFPLIEMSVDANDNPESANWLTAAPTQTSIKEEAMSLSVYPNPADNVLQIDVNTQVDKVIITDITGKIVMNESIRSTSSVNVDGLKSGVYFVSVYNDEKVKTVKFIKK